MLKKLNNNEQFIDVIKNGKWLVDFFATWCGPCKMLEPVLEEFSKTCDVLQVDVDQFGDLAQSFGIMSVPTLMYFKDGELVSRDVGYKSLEELNRMTK